MCNVSIAGFIILNTNFIKSRKVKDIKVSIDSVSKVMQITQTSNISNLLWKMFPNLDIKRKPELNI